MNLLRSKQSIVTKVMRDNNGVECFVRFLIVETEAGIDVRVLSATPIAANTQTKYQISGVVEKNKPSEHISYSKNPFAVLVDDLKFFISQPTRAPSFA